MNERKCKISRRKTAGCKQRTWRAEVSVLKNKVFSINLWRLWRHVADGVENDSAEHIDVRRHFVFYNMKLIICLP
jgi:hypothetical protein